MTGVERLSVYGTALACLLTFLIASAMAPAAVADGRLSVYVVNYPLKYFAERIGGEQVAVELPVPAGEDPAFWTPTPEVIAAYQSADLILLNGAAYAKWVATASLPRSRLVDTSRGFADRLVAGEGVTHSHGTAGTHAHGNLAFTTWLDLSHAAAQARAIMEALVRRQPHLEAPLERNFDALELELMSLDARLQTMAQRAPDRPLLASHPVYQYLARRYGLNVQSVHWEPDEVPGDDEWPRLTSRLREHPAKWMLWEYEPNPASVRRLEAMGIGSVVFSPCAAVPEEGDFMTVMRTNVENLLRAFQ